MLIIILSSQIFISMAAAPPSVSSEVQDPSGSPEGIVITQLPDKQTQVAAERFVFGSDGSVMMESAPEVLPPSHQCIEISAEAVEVSPEGDVTFIGNPQFKPVSQPPISQLLIDGRPANLADVISARAVEAVHIDRCRQILSIATKR